MDIPRQNPKSRRRMAYMAGGVGAVLLATLGLSRLKPAAPTVELGTIWMDTVVRGPMTLQVRGPGTLVPEQIRWIVAVTPGRVERVMVQPGASVTEGTVLLELSNPDVQIQALEAQRQLTASQADLVSLRTTLEAQRLNQAGAVATLRAEYRDAVRQANADSALMAQDLISAAEFGRSHDRAEEMTERLALEEKRLEIFTKSMEEQHRVQEEQVTRLKAIAEFQRRLVESMVVRAGAAGVVQEVPLQVGQWAMSGATLAKVVQPGRLKAVLRIPETQARDVAIGQPATIDTRNGLVQGRVVRIDPGSSNGTVTVDVTLEGTLPRGARPDLSVDGTVELARLDNVLRIARPAFGQANATVSLFRLLPDGETAERVPVTLGRNSVNEVEITRGLDEGDVVVLSDMSRWDAVERVRIH